MAPLDTSDARPITSAGDFERLLREAEGRPDLVVALYRKSSGKQTVPFHALAQDRDVPRLGRYRAPTASTTSRT